ncbi:MAG: head GIN domain-containing protein [bacterium]
MKKLLLIAFISTATILNAQSDISKTVGEFSTLKVYDLISVNLVKSDENRVEISGNNAEDVEVINKNGTLKIRMTIDEIFDGNRTEVTLFHTGFDILDTNEGAYISSSDIIEHNDLELRAQEGGQIKIKVDTKFTEIKAYTGGIINLEGTAGKVIYRVNTGGIAETRNLEVTNAEIKIRAGGEVEVNAQMIDVNIRAGGDVFIFGDPKTVKEDRVLGGRLIYMEN